MSANDRVVTWEEVSQHMKPSNCWVVVDGRVYNVTDFLVEHPGGDEILIKWSGLDASAKFHEAKHSEYAVSLRNARLVGKLDKKQYPEGYQEKIKNIKSEEKRKAKPKVRISEPISMEMVKAHQSQQSCWIVIDNFVYDVTSYLYDHPGGVSKIMDFAGRDASKGFQQAGHSLEAMQKKQQYLVGSLARPTNYLLLKIAAVLLIAVVVVVVKFY